MQEAETKEMERRQFPRLEKTLPIKFDLPRISSSAGAFEALGRNIGEGGLFVETDLVQDEELNLNRKTILNLELELLGQSQRLRPKAEIAWISKKSRAPRKVRGGMGLRFIQLSAEEKRILSLFISQETLSLAGVLPKELPALTREERLNDRGRRNLEILDAIRKSRLISRAEISKETDINIVTVSNYIDNYLKKGLVLERGLDISTGGRRPELVEINPRYGYVLGVDYGSCGVEGALMQAVAADFTTRVVARAEEKRENDNPEDSWEALKNLIAKVLADASVEKEKIRGIGLGISGIMDKFGGTLRHPRKGASFTNYLALKKKLEDVFNLPVVVENSAPCALFAEKWAGANLEAKAAENIVYLFSAHQCAIILKGELYTGASKSAGWLERACGDDFSAGNANSDSDTSDCSDAAALGLKVGAQVAYLVNLLNPQLAIIGAEFNHLGEPFLEGVRHAVSRWAWREGTQQLRIITAALGREAVALGAASLVIESAFANI